ncbi:MAG TPA: PAS domain S-box protein [Polyangia bacterium]|nr:PAS domain S-box protein [Polyangia bacterium]
MERGRIQLVGVDEEPEHSFAQTLRSAGYRVTCSPRIVRDAGAQILLVFGPSMVENCRLARSVYPMAQVIACIEGEQESEAGEFLAAGADDVIMLTPVMPPRSALLARIRAGMAHVELRYRIEHDRQLAELLEQVMIALAEAELDPIEGLFDVAVKLAEFFCYDRCTVLVVGTGDPNTIYVAAASDEPSLTRWPLDLRKYPELRAVLDGREPVYISDVAASPLLGEHAVVAAMRGGRCQLLLPLVTERGADGVLWLRSVVPRPPPDRSMLRLLKMIARMVSISLRDARLEMLRESTQVTSWAQVRQRRVQALDQYRDFFESAADGMLVVDRSGEVLYVNRAAEQLTGFSRTGLVGRQVGEVVSEEQRPMLADAIEQAVAGLHLTGFDLQLLTTSGEPLRVSVSTSRVVADEDTSVVTLTFRDVTLARLLEEELRKTKEFLERLIDSTVDAIIAADVRGRVMIFNRGAELLFGYKAEEIVHRMPVWKLYPEGEAKRVMAELRSEEHGGVGRLLPTRREIVTRDGQLVPVMLSASIIYEDGRPVATVGILNDMRDRLSIEQRLAQAQQKLLVTEKQALIADLAGTAAHELNQPLTSVMGYAELLKKRLPPDDPSYRAVDTILTEAERMAAIVRKIGKITRYETKPYIGSTNILDLDKSVTEG